MHSRLNEDILKMSQNTFSLIGDLISSQASSEAPSTAINIAPNDSSSASRCSVPTSISDSTGNPLFLTSSSLSAKRSRSTIVVTRTFLPEHIPVNLAVVAGVPQRIAGPIREWLPAESFHTLLAFRAAVKQGP